MLNALAFDPKQDIAEKLNDIIKDVPNGTTLLLPEGKYFTTQTILQENKALRWQGQNTEIEVYHDQVGLRLTQNQTVGRTYMDDILFSNHKNDHHNDQQHGIESCVPFTMRGGGAINFYGDGLNITGDKNTRPGTDASFCYIADVILQSNRGHGYYTAGGDANYGLFFNVDTRDNRKKGGCDNSWFGNVHQACKAHNNAGGNFAALGVGTRANFFGCYSEAGGEPDHLKWQSMWFGGFPTNNIILENFAVVVYPGSMIQAPWYPPNTPDRVFDIAQIPLAMRKKYKDSKVSPIPFITPIPYV